MSRGSLPSPLMVSLVSDDVLNEAYSWLCQSRREYPDHADIWDFRRNWPTERAVILNQLISGEYRFGLMTRIEKDDGTEFDLWSARDALVMKALSIVLAPVLPISSHCVHIKGNGGLKGAVRQVQSALKNNRYVIRTDVKSFYASIDHVLLIDRVARYVKDSIILNLLGQYMKRTAECGGWFWTYDRGIFLGSSLSPLMGALFLGDLDERMQGTGLFYVRYMDDILLLSPTRWKLRRAIKALNEELNTLRLEKHPDKTIICPVERGFDFLGHHFNLETLSIAETSIQKFAAQASRLYEQGQRDRASAPLFGKYVRRWLAWATGGLGHVGGDAANSTHHAPPVASGHGAGLSEHARPARRRGGGSTKGGRSLGRNKGRGLGRTVKREDFSSKGGLFRW